MKDHMFEISLKDKQIEEFKGKCKFFIFLKFFNCFLFKNIFFVLLFFIFLFTKFQTFPNSKFHHFEFFKFTKKYQKQKIKMKNSRNRPQRIHHHARAPRRRPPGFSNGISSKQPKEKRKKGDENKHGQCSNSTRFTKRSPRRAF